MILAGESSFDCSRALKKSEVSIERMLYGDMGGPMWTYVVDDDWLVREDILVFGGHSTLGEGEGMGWLCG